MRIELKDYSTVEGEFDKVAAIGIQEHIGIDNYPNYYETMKRVLKRDGLFLHHAIMRPAKRSDRSFRRKRPEFALLTKYIFPGGELDHIGNTVASLERNGFEVHDVEGWREHYQRTCRHWHDRLLANYDQAVAEVGEVEDADLARLSRGLLDHLRAQQRAALPDARRRAASAAPPACRRRGRISIAEALALPSRSRFQAVKKERDSPLPACGEGSAFGRTSGAKRSGGEGAVQKKAPSPTPRLLRHRPLTLAYCAGLPPSAALSPQAGRGGPARCLLELDRRLDDVVQRPVVEVSVIFSRIAPFAFAARTAFSISRWEVTPTSFRNLRIAMLNRSSSMLVLHCGQVG